VKIVVNSYRDQQTDLASNCHIRQLIRFSERERERLAVTILPCNAYRH
jgi:hypothetical protein